MKQTGFILLIVGAVLFVASVAFAIMATWSDGKVKGILDNVFGTLIMLAGLIGVTGYILYIIHLLP